MRLHGRIEDLFLHGDSGGLARFRFDLLHGPAQVGHGLDWLVLCALDKGRALAQFHEGVRGQPPELRQPVAAEAAREALHTLLRLRTQGLQAPLPFGSRAGWLWYHGEAELAAGKKPRANAKTPWQHAHEQWHSERAWSEGDTASARLALRGRDPFGDTADDAQLGEDFRAIATLVFDAVVHGRGEARA